MSEFLVQEGQFLLPMLDLIAQAEMAVDEPIESPGSGVRLRTRRVCQRAG